MAVQLGRPAVRAGSELTKTGSSNRSSIPITTRNPTNCLQAGRSCLQAVMLLWQRASSLPTAAGSLADTNFSIAWTPPAALTLATYFPKVCPQAAAHQLNVTRALSSPDTALTCECCAALAAPRRLPGRGSSSNHPPVECGVCPQQPRHRAERCAAPALATAMQLKSPANSSASCPQDGHSPVEGDACPQQFRHCPERHVLHPRSGKGAAVGGEVQRAAQSRLPYALLALLVLRAEWWPKHRKSRSQEGRQGVQEPSMTTSDEGTKKIQKPRSSHRKGARSICFLQGWQGSQKQWQGSWDALLPAIVQQDRKPPKPSKGREPPKPPKSSGEEAETFGCQPLCNKIGASLCPRSV